MNDPYKMLGVSSSATLDEIKKAYRKLAKSLHPDLNPGNKESEKKFKEVSHAFDLIGTAEARAKFDRGETDDQQRQKYEEHSQRQKQNSFYDSQQSYGRYSSSFGEGFDGEELFSSIFGGGRRRGSSQMKTAGADELYQLEVEFREAALGAEKIITLPNGKKLQVKIPAGVEDGKKLRFKGLGGSGHGNGPAGDAYVQIHIKRLEGFTRKGVDIETEVAVSIFEAITGGEIEVPTIDGVVMMKIPSGVCTGTKLRIKGKGMGQGDSRGNQIVKLKIVLPKNIDPDLAESIKNLQHKFDYNPRNV